MKKSILIVFLIFAATSLKGYCETYFELPIQYLNDIKNTKVYQTETNAVERLLMQQVMKNSTINGVSLEDFSVDNLIEYFNQDQVFKQQGNKLVEPNTGAVIEFESDDRCKNSNVCTMKVDLNGNEGPNEEWTDSSNPKDQIIFKIKKDDEGNVKLIFPNMN